MVGYSTIVGICVAFLIFSICMIFFGDAKINELQSISPVTTAVQSQLEAYELGVTIAKITVILSVITIAFMLMSVSWMPARYVTSEPIQIDRGVTFMSPEEAHQQQQVQVDISTPDRFEAILNDGWEL